MVLLNPMLRALGVFCFALGATYLANKIFDAPADLLYLAPGTALLWLGIDIILSTRTRGGKS
jgi:hypothetical protein